MKGVEKYLETKLQEREGAGNLRRLTTQRAPVDFYSNDYLGFATNGIVAGTADNESTGSTGSRLLSGNSMFAEQLEIEIAAFHRSEAALLFNSGYDANMGLLASIGNRGITTLYDELCHASIIDGVRLGISGHNYKFRHNDITDLEQKLKRFAANGPMAVVVESVYSMDGDFAPLHKIVALLKQFDAVLIVDEAHATGVFGTNGEGLVCSLGLQDEVFARVHTYGKALGCHGAAVVGTNTLKQYLINFARSFIYTTALPGHSVAAISNAYKALSAPDFSNKDLHVLIANFREKIKVSGQGNWKDSKSPIQALIIGNNEMARQIAAALQKEGLQVNAILSPTVAKGAERLRICLHSFNTTAQVDQLFDIINTTKWNG